MHKPSAQVFSALSTLPFPLFFVSLSTTAHHLTASRAGGLGLLLVGSVLVLLPTTLLRRTLLTTGRTGPPSRPRILASTVLLLAVLACLACDVHVRTIPLYLAAPTLGLFLLHSLLQWSALIHLRSTTQSDPPSRLDALASLYLNHPYLAWLP